MDRKEIGVLWAGLLVVLGLIVSALELAGITNMSVARFLLIAAGLAAVIAVITAESLATRSKKHVLKWSIIVALICGPILFGIDSWMLQRKEEKERQEKQSKIEKVTPTSDIDLAADIGMSRSNATGPRKTRSLLRTIQTAAGKVNVCDSPPIHAVLNSWPVTYNAPAEICHDLPLIDGRKIDGEFSKSEEDWKDGLTAQHGETIALLIWISNGAANNYFDPRTGLPIQPAPTTAVARNISVKTSMDTSPGTTHYVQVAVSGDNVETIYGKFRINTNSYERLVAIPKSAQVLNYTSDKILADHFDMGNNVVKIGDLRPNFDDGLFLYFFVRVVDDLKLLKIQS